MKNLQFYAANLYSMDCNKSAEIYSHLFSMTILTKTVNHSELISESGLHLFIDRPSTHCIVTPGSISFIVPELDINILELKPLLLEKYYQKENYASYLDEYKNRIWIFAKKNKLT